MNTLVITEFSFGFNILVLCEHLATAKSVLDLSELPLSRFLIPYCPMYLSHDRS